MAIRLNAATLRHAEAVSRSQRRSSDGWERDKVGRKGLTNRGDSLLRQAGHTQRQTADAQQLLRIEAARCLPGPKVASDSQVATVEEKRAVLRLAREEAAAALAKTAATLLRQRTTAASRRAAPPKHVSVSALQGVPRSSVAQAATEAEAAALRARKAAAAMTALKAQLERRVAALVKRGAFVHSSV